MDNITKQFIEDYMTFSCKYCSDIKKFTDCNGKFTKCLEKTLYIAEKMLQKGWVMRIDNEDN